MNISRSFLLIGSLYLLVGIGLGSHMGASGDHTLAPVHAHINLLGFVLMTLFGLAYRVMPAMAAGALTRAHFWLHQAGSLVLLIGLFLMMGGMVAAESIGPVFPLAELSILAGVVCFLVNLWRHA